MKELLRNLIEEREAAGTTWLTTIWNLRRAVNELETEYVERVRSELEAKVGAVLPGEELTAMERAEKALIDLEGK